MKLLDVDYLYIDDKPIEITIIRDGSLRCDIYEIFVGTIFAFLYVACWIFPIGGMTATQPRQLSCHYNPQITHSAIT